jgi:hypothetical protein
MQNGTINQSRHLLSLLTILQGIIDGCLPEIEEIRRLSYFLNAPSMVHGTSALSTSQLTDWIARMCLRIEGKSIAPDCNNNKRKRSDPTVQDVTRPEILPCLQYAALCVNSHFHGINNRLMFHVTWHELGSSNTVEPYGNIYHLDVLREYELRLEAGTQSAHCKALYRLQRDKERSAIVSEDDTDTEMTHEGESVHGSGFRLVISSVLVCVSPYVIWGLEESASG